MTEPSEMESKAPEANIAAKEPQEQENEQHETASPQFNPNVTMPVNPNARKSRNKKTNRKLRPWHMPKNRGTGFEGRFHFMTSRITN